MAMTIGFRPTEDDERILRAATRDGETRSDTIRRALRLLEQERWTEEFRRDAERIADEDLNAEPEAW
jgi:antitoxin ParD1/3/4